ncbi:hypothetical protein CVD28_01025 [Bacillus sp. M6-12]|uniref:hypothetical protein n=1 Tax=Bacillus sp. M6-12 TaxID=2054166 RepID=UPI000C759F4D|nr:hypothetical protein [Bacillus sp. M6-12]PLS19016.1 hypothetical protein CVD28_01025 [Bacillus sp. M6-12]
MLTFKEKMGSIYLMDKDTEEIRYEVTEPAVLLDTTFFALLKIGNRDIVMSYYEESIAKCKIGQTDLFESWVVMDLPKDAEVLDKILNNVGYLESFYQKVIESLPKGE